MNATRSNKGCHNFSVRDPHKFNIIIYFKVHFDIVAFYHCWPVLLFHLLNGFLRELRCVANILSFRFMPREVIFGCRTKIFGLIVNGLNSVIIKYQIKYVCFHGLIDLHRDGLSGSHPLCKLHKNVTK